MSTVTRGSVPALCPDMYPTSEELNLWYCYWEFGSATLQAYFRCPEHVWPSVSRTTQINPVQREVSRSNDAQDHQQPGGVDDSSSSWQNPGSIDDEDPREPTGPLGSPGSNQNSDSLDSQDSVQSPRDSDSGANQDEEATAANHGDAASFPAANEDEASFGDFREALPPHIGAIIQVSESALRFCVTDPELPSTESDVLSFACAEAFTGFTFQPGFEEVCSAVYSRACAAVFPGWVTHTTRGHLHHPTTRPGSQALWSTPTHWTGSNHHAGSGVYPQGGSAQWSWSSGSPWGGSTSGSDSSWPYWSSFHPGSYHFRSPWWPHSGDPSWPVVGDGDRRATTYNPWSWLSSYSGNQGGPWSNPDGSWASPSWISGIGTRLPSWFPSSVSDWWSPRPITGPTGLPSDPSMSSSDPNFLPEFLAHFTFHRAGLTSLAESGVPCPDPVAQADAVSNFMAKTNFCKNFFEIDLDPTVVAIILQTIQFPSQSQDTAPDAFVREMRESFSLVSPYENCHTFMFFIHESFRSALTQGQLRFSGGCQWQDFVTPDPQLNSSAPDSDSSISGSGTAHDSYFRVVLIMMNLLAVIVLTLIIAVCVIKIRKQRQRRQALLKYAIPIDSVSVAVPPFPLKEVDPKTGNTGAFSSSPPDYDTTKRKKNLGPTSGLAAPPTTGYVYQPSLLQGSPGSIHTSHTTPAKIQTFSPKMSADTPLGLPLNAQGLPALPPRYSFSAQSYKSDDPIVDAWEEPRRLSEKNAHALRELAHAHRQAQLERRASMFSVVSQPTKE